ncbi:hypothetical protein D3OALGA1CA_3151 [Olavius algarvensis associated proteobacterium Delta 3]|nr:hypothetical protein D3OALGA1CA_3151 [Olavius algarvensis associated proteobacterium Delta 3]CAB5159395.1 hypothetical protein D3OALGB2SA_5332 [Olavius algarvensis associated proteobacterium Delta 3]
MSLKLARHSFHKKIPKSRNIAVMIDPVSEIGAPAHCWSARPRKHFRHACHYENGTF